MKKLFKKSIACLIAVLMVVSTMPFTAITAQAADGYEVLGKVNIDPIIYTHGTYSGTTDSEYAYMNYGSTIADGSYDGECKTAVSSTETISSVEAVGVSGASVRVENGLLKGTLGTTYEGSDKADTTVTLKFTFSDGTYEYHKMPVKTNPVAQHVFGVAQRWTGATKHTLSWKRTIAFEMLAVGSYGNTNYGSKSSDREGMYNNSKTENFSKMYEPFKSEHVSSTWKSFDFFSSALETNKKTGYGAMVCAQNNNLNLEVSSVKGQYYLDLSTDKNYGLYKENGEYYINIFVGKIKDNFDGESVNYVSRSVSGVSDAGIVDISATSIIGNNVNKGTDQQGYIKCKVVSPTAGNTVEANTSITYKSNDSTYVKLVLNLPFDIKITDKSNTRNLYNNYISNLDPRCYTADSWATFRDKLLTAEEFLNDNTDNSSDATAKSNLENARNALVANSDSSAHNHYTDTITKQATCTENGSTKRTCTCGYSYTDNTIPAATGHTEGEAVEENRVEATCTTDGSYDLVVRCTVCNAELSRETKTITAPGHTWGDWAYNEAEDNHTEIRRCSVCNATETRDCTYEETGTTTATCKVKGSTTYTCKTCNHSYTNFGEVNPDNHVNTTHHDGKAATCTEDGWTAYEVCDDCKAEIGKTVLKATGHSLKKVNEVPSTCTVKGTAAYWTCTKCNKKFSDEQGKNEISAPVELPLADHSWGDWTSISDTQHKRVCANDPSHVETEQHNIVNGACKKCDYVAFDMATYNSAVKEYEEIIGAGDYAEKYTEASRTAYQEAVEAAKRDSFATKEEVDAAVAAILSAKTNLVYAQPEIKFVEVDVNGNETVIETKNYTYGTPVEFTKNADNIAKWIVKTQNGNVETKVATSQTTYTMIATEPATVYVHLTEEKTEAVQYSKVSFISKNGAVSFVKYVPAGTTLYTNTVDGVEIPFYEFKNWNKASVTADGSDIEVKAVYEFIGEETNKCNVHYNGSTKTYTYDSFVYLFGAEDKTLALSTDGTVENIITYLNENAFYAPHTADIYVITVARQPASIGITGSYASSTDTKKTAAFNCKFFLPAGCTVVEYGLTATSSTGKSIKIKAEAASARGEYCVKVSMAKKSSVTSVEGVAYLTYRTAEGTPVTIYSTPVTQNL